MSSFDDPLDPAKRRISLILQYLDRKPVDEAKPSGEGAEAKPGEAEAKPSEKSGEKPPEKDAEKTAEKK